MNLPLIKLEKICDILILYHGMNEQEALKFKSSCLVEEDGYAGGSTYIVYNNCKYGKIGTDGYGDGLIIFDKPYEKK